MARRRGLVLENIEAGACELAGDQCLMQRRLVDDSTARGVDQIGGGFHALQSGRIEHPDRLRGFWTVDADEIGAR